MQQQGGKENFQDHHPRVLSGSSCSLGQDPASARGTGWVRGWKGDKQRKMEQEKLPGELRGGSRQRVTPGLLAQPKTLKQHQGTCQPLKLKWLQRFGGNEEEH